MDKVSLVPPMSRTGSFVVGKPIQEVRDLILAKLASMGARMNTVSDSYVEAKTGSQVAMRLKGGMIAKPTELPMRTSVALHSQGDSTSVQVTTSDVVVFGFKLGMKNKYDHALQEMIDELRAAVGGVAS